MHLVVDAETVRGVVRIGGSSTDVLGRLRSLRGDVIANYFEWPSLSPSSPSSPSNRSTRDEKLDDARFECTLRFVLEDVRQGVYCLYRGGRVRLIASVANTRFENDFGAKVRFRCSDVDHPVTFRELERRFPCRTRGWLPPRNWWASNHILCTKSSDGGLGWGTAMLAEIRDLFDGIRGIPDCEFIVNRRDVPMIRADGGSAYEFALASPPRHTARLRVFSLYQGDTWLDEPLVTLDGHGTVTRPSAPAESAIKWDLKKETLFFRGSATGRGTTPAMNTRMRAAGVRAHCPALLDIGIVGISKREKFVSQGVVALDSSEEAPRTKERVPLHEWPRWKYLLYIEGHSAALRMVPLLSSGSVVVFLRPRADAASSAGRLWFFSRLKFFTIKERASKRTRDGGVYDTRRRGGRVHDENVLVVDDVSHLEHATEWLRAHDEDARRLALNALELSRYVKDDRVDFMRRQLLSARPVC
jgi:hypothetical protein